MTNYHYILGFLLLISSGSYSQNFQIINDKDEVKIPVDIISNLMVVRASVNGTSMRFILDSGATRTTIFNINGVDSLTIGAGVNTTVRGYGSLEPFQAVNSKGNVISIDDFVAVDSDIYVLTNKQISFVPLLGEEVNGIIGLDFYKNHFIELDYEKSRITVTDTINSKVRNRYGTPIEITTLNNKTYINANALNKGSSQEMSLLLDTGSGDALWFFEKSSDFIMPTKGFKDYLGFGLSGDIYGFRSKIEALNIGAFSFNKVTVAFPELITQKPAEKKDIVQGSIGGEILRRFKILMDYPNGHIYLESNRSFKDGFYYNMAGLKLKEGDKELVTEIQYGYDNEAQRENRSLKKIDYTINKSISYSYIPKTMISYVVPNSPADLAGLKEGDQIVDFNGKGIGKFTTGEISQSFYQRPHSTIDLTIKSGDKVFTVSLQLIPLIEDD